MKRFLSLLCIISLIGSLGLSFALPAAAIEEMQEPFVNLYNTEAARCGTVANNGSVTADFRSWSSAVMEAAAGDTICFGPVDPSRAEHLVYWLEGVAVRPDTFTVVDTFDNGQQILSYRMPGEAIFSVMTEASYNNYFVVTKNDPFNVADFYAHRAAQGKNLYLRELGILGAYVDANGDGTALKTNVNHNSTGAIPVTEGDTVTFGPALTNQTFHGSAFNAEMGFVDNAIQKGELTQTAVFPNGSSIFTYTVPKGVSYVRIVNRTTYRDYFYVAKNNVFDVEEYYTLKGADPKSPLIGKSALYLGDSICRGASDYLYYSASANKTRDTWGGRIAEQYDMTYVKAGKSGASFSTCRNNNRVLAQVNTYKSNDYDYVILEGGINDAMDKVAVGAVSASFDPADFDPDTFAGGMEELVYNTVLNFGDTAAIGYILTPASTAYNSRTFDPTEYFAVARQICQKWGISYLDFATEEMGELIQLDSTRYLPDHLHPNSAGYDLLTPYIATWMETLKPYAGLINLYDRTKAQAGYYTANGSINSGDTRYLSAEKIAVAAGDVLHFGPADSVGQGFQLYYWNEAGVATKVGHNSSSTTEGLALVDTIEGNNVIYSYTAPGAGTVGIVLNVANDETFLITKNQAFDAEDFAAYWEGNEDEAPTLQESVLNGKTALFSGDSITIATRDTAGLSGWAGRIGKYYQLSYFTNAGVSGTSLSTTRESGSGRIKWQITTQAAYHYDYVILHGGVNDAWDKVAVGEMSDSFELKDFDTDTFAGGLEELFYYATKYHETSAIGYLINFKLGSTKGNLADMSAYVAEAIRICNKWGIPYLDMYNHQEITAKLQITTAAHSTDGIHPAPSGYDILYPYIGEWMETLEPYSAGTAEAHQSHVIACVGDSITMGQESTDINRYSYPEQLQNMLGKGYDVLNFGWGGATAQETTSNPYKKTLMYKQSRECDPDSVIVMLGSNDAKEENWDASDPTAAKAKYKADLKELVSGYQALPSKPDIYLASPARASSASSWNKVFDGGMVAAVEEVAEELGCTYININALTTGTDESLYIGTAHFNNEGYRILAGHMYKGFTGKDYVAPTAQVTPETNPAMPLMRNYEQYPNAAQYRLETVEDVEKFGDLIASGVTFAGKTVQLMNDLDFGDHHFRPLGYSTGTTTPDHARNFQGVFEGNYHTLSNIHITFMYYGVALFPATKGATIRNLGIRGGCIKGNDVVASVVAYGDHGTQITNVWSSVDLFAANSTGANGSAGIASNMRKQDTRVPQMTNVAYYGTITGANANGLCAWGQAALQAKNCVFAGQIEHLGKGSDSTCFVRYNKNTITGLTANFFGLESAGNGNKTYDDGSRTFLSAEAYANGEAAYRLNAIEGAVWTVKDGYTIPWGAAETETHRVKLGGAVCYTDYQGRLLQTAGAEASRFWKDAENNAYSRTSLRTHSFAADAALIEALTGDVDLNDAVDTADLVLLLRHLIGAEAANEIMADLNEDASITIMDAVSLLRIVAE